MVGHAFSAIPTDDLFGIFKDVRFYPILNFGLFWAPLFSRCFYPIMNFGHFWTPPFFKISGFYPTRNFGHFWAAFSKMSLHFSKFLGRLRRHTQCPFSRVFLCVFLLSLALALVAFFVSRRTLLLHVVLVLAWLLLPIFTGLFEIAQSFQHRRVKKTKKRRKPR